MKIIPWMLAGVAALAVALFGTDREVAIFVAGFFVALGVFRP